MPRMTINHSSLVKEKRIEKKRRREIDGLGFKNFK